MRFNDLFATILSGHSESDWSRAILWRQCLDLLAQYGGGEAAELGQVTATFIGLRGQVGVERKQAALRELGGRLRSARLVELLLDEETPVQVAAMTHARLPDPEWPAIIAKGGPLARSVLRQRADLGPEARRALDAFGLSDLSLRDLSLIELSADMQVEEEPIAEADVADGSQSQIRRIVDRIERFTSERQDRAQRDPVQEPAQPAQPEEPDVVPEPIAALAFTADPDGIIQSVDAARAHLAGIRLAMPSMDRSIGPDGQILGAFRRRGAFREGRLTLGPGALEGCWLVDGDPLFDQRTGRFKGYRCAARRASSADLAPQLPVPVADREEGVGAATSHSTSLRQLIHELRSPLNGVMGFAELIESQLLGPVSDPYRTMAGDIVEDVRSLVDILDDLDLANRTDRLRSPGLQGSDVAMIVRDMVGRLGQDGEGQGGFAPDLMEKLPVVDVAPAIAERMIAHLLRALAGCVGTETLAMRWRIGDDRLTMEIDRPTAMHGLSDDQLFDSGLEPVAVNKDAPILGIGFALRLVRRLAMANKGGLSVHPDYFTLTLPVRARPAEQEISV